MRNPPCRTLLASLPLLAATFAAHAQTKVDISTGLTYSSGDYGETTATDTTVLPLSLRVKTGNWTLRASTAFLRMDGPADVAVLPDDNSGRGGGGGRDHPEDDGSDSTDGSRSGISDTSLSATYSFDALGGSSTYLDLTGRVRLPTGDEDKGLGIGATDYALTTEFGYEGDAGGAFITAGRRFLGDVTGLDRQDGWQAGVGVWRDIGERTSIGAGYDWREKSTPTATDDPAEIYAYLNRRVGDSWRIGLNASTGLNEASADYSVGVSLTWRVGGY